MAFDGFKKGVTPFSIRFPSSTSTGHSARGPAGRRATRRGGGGAAAQTGDAQHGEARSGRRRSTGGPKNPPFWSVCFKGGRVFVLLRGGWPLFFQGSFFRLFLGFGARFWSENKDI